jgi:mycofactocin system glycosyltransferase
MPRFRLDASVRRFGPTVVGGSPLKLFRLTGRGAATVDAVAAGLDVAGSRLTEALLDAGAIHPCPEHPSVYGPDDVTVIVPSFGPPAHVPPDAVLVDDGSRPPITGATIRLPRNRGPAAARNTGLARVTTPLVAFVDADVRVRPGWLDGLLPHFTHPRVALVAPRVRSRPSAGLLGHWERRHSPLDLGPDPARVRAGSRVAYVPAAAVVCRTDALRGIGGFDESLRYGEDVDLVWRLDGAGWRCRYEPAVEVEHEPRPDWRSWARQRIAYGASAAPLARRHRGALAPFRASGWSVAVWTLGAMGHPVLAGGVGAGTGVALARRLRDLPFRDAFGLAVAGNGRAGEQLATAIRRAWWPILALAAIRSRRARRVLAAALLAAGHPLRVADDVAYSIGVWRGVVHERTVAPLRPDLTGWPGRRTPTTAAAEPLPSSG